MQTDFTRLDTVLVTLINLYRQFLDPTLDNAVRIAVHASIEKRWANCDRPIFILALVLNPYICVSAFSRTSPYRMPDKLWELTRKAFIRFYSAEPDMDFRAAFSQYIRGQGVWSDTSMRLQQYTVDAEHAVRFLKKLLLF